MQQAAGGRDGSREKREDRLFAALLEEHTGSVSRVFRRAGVPAAAVEDLTQETLTRCWESRRRVRSLTKRSIRAYMHKIAQNALTDHFRSREEKLKSFEEISEALGVNAESVITGLPWDLPGEEPPSIEQDLQLRREKVVGDLLRRLAVERSPKDAALILGYLQGRKMPEMLPGATAHERTAAYRRVTRALQWAAEELKCVFADHPTVCGEEGQ